MSEPATQTNHIGLKRDDYAGAKTTLCVGCGHDQITRWIIQAAYESGVDPYNVAKTSGIGCSSKTPAYFISRGYGINSCHGRMPSVATGASLANRNLAVIGVSGDGDTASIGMGQFVHAVRRNVDMVYIVENNGVYGLTKGQFSATSDKGARVKSGETNDFSDIDLCQLALNLGCGFVARSFSGDGKQMTALIRAAIAHRGFALIDAISPCVTFNNLPDSTKGFQWLREHNVALHDLGFVAPWDAPQVEQKAGEPVGVDLPDGSHLILRPLADHEHDPTRFESANEVLRRDRRDTGTVYTGLIYFKPSDRHPPLEDVAHLGETPLALMGAEELRPSRAAFEGILAAHR
ncbi:MAG: 2-oxoacid:ferredoxin oxidoreductase subunit beta [Planctomycetes bacterium]|nr:2-oxoacid:ferredoxin oxidoreductase subunit beta [Planctomycetota bacterium]